MGLLDNITGLFKPKVEAKEVPQSRNIRNKLTERYIPRFTPDLNRFKSAVMSAESVTNPNRNFLIQEYRQVDQDAHLSSVCMSRDLAALSSPFKLCDANGEEIPETMMFEAKWFEDICKEYLKAKYWGYSVIELTRIENDNVEFDVLPRTHVVPELSAVKVEVNLSVMNSNKGVFFYDSPIYKNSVIPVYDKQNPLGLYFKVAPLVIYKRYSMANWSEFAEKYGMPMAIGKTGISDQVSRDNMTGMLSEFGSALYAVISDTDSVELLSNTSTDAYNVYLQLIDLANAEISKLIVGQTMTTDDGSSRSQAEVHQDVFYNLVQYDMKGLASFVNKELIPRLQYYGMSIPQGAFFKWDNEERLSTLERLQIDTELLKYYKLPAEYIMETYNVPVEDMPAPQINMTENEEPTATFDAHKYLAKFEDFYNSTHDCSNH